jgi:hypothetical protein
MDGEEFPAYTFADSKGRRWCLEIDWDTRCKVKNTLGIDLATVVQSGFKTLDSVANDPEKFMQLVWLIAEPQAVAAGVAPEEFGKSWNGDCFFEAYQSLVEACILFFRNPRARQGLRELMAKNREIVERAGQMAVETINVDAEARKLIDLLGSVQQS